LRYSVAQLIVFVTIVAFLLAFGSFLLGALLGALERFFIPISVIGFFVFLNWSRMHKGKNVLLALAISLPAILVWAYMALTYYRLIALGSVESMDDLEPTHPQPFPHPDVVLDVFLEDSRLSKNSPTDLGSILRRTIGLIGLVAACLAGWFMGSLIRRKSVDDQVESGEDGE
jgi:hypothetical protein